MRNAQQIRQERAAVIAEARGVRDQMESAGDEIPQDLTEKFNGLMARAEALDAEARAADARETSFARLEQWTNDEAQVEGRRSNPLPHQDASNRKHGYSLLRAIQLILNNRAVDGLEGEVSDEIASRTKMTPQGQIFVPWDLTVQRQALRPERRDLTTSNSGGAIGTQISPTMIDALRARMLVQQLGAQLLTDLNGNFSIPKQTAASSASWKAEGVDFGESSPTIGQVAFTPNRVGTFVEFSKSLLRQSSLSIENMVRSDLTMAVALGLDHAALNGSGVSPEPEGILQNSDVPTVAIDTNGGAPTFAKMVELESTVETANALLANLAYVTTPALKGKLKSTPVATYGSEMVWDPMTNLVNGYPAHATSQLPADLTKGSGTALSSAIFGDWSSVVIGLWGAADLAVNPFSGDKAGLVRIVIEQLADVNLRHAESFAKIVDAVTA